ncbi:MAG: M23 family metallopeptidase [Desulfobulbaceae bacterium]|nr:M23 family metallopeptidase [Desulfobulbaceae bacterium]
MAFRNRKKSRGSRFLWTSFLFILMIAGAAIFILFFEGEKPVIDLQQTSAFIGKKGNIDYSVTDSTSGIHTIFVWGSQGNVRKMLHSVAYPRTTYTGAVGPLEDTRTVTFDVQKEGFSDGAMTITVEATDFSFRGWLTGNKAVATKEVIVDTIPPKIQIIHNEKYISPGGTGIAIYRLSDKDSSHGITMNKQFNPGFPIGDGRDDIYISFFGLPFDTDRLETLNVSATDMAGNNTVVPFTTVYKPVNQKRDTINISDGFLNSKIPEFQQYYPEMQGDFIDKYLFANSTVRVQNNEKIRELCSNPQPERVWKGHFSRMPGSSRAGFADHRTYFYKGNGIDQQVHLGMDIASTKRADVRAANAGKIAFADYLGIYGNMVLVDHGQGVFSLYSHLSQINVTAGDMVDQKTVLGLTGTTGMAGGDHLHFSMLVNGVFVTPKEWWDQHWVEVTIEEPITDSKF